MQINMQINNANTARIMRLFGCSACELAGFWSSQTR